MDSAFPRSVGIYSQPDAAHLLGIALPRLRRWVGGYTYWLRSPEATEKKRQPPLIRSELPRLRGKVALSFLEMMELRVVRALLEKELSLQHIRAAARLVGDRFGTAHPLASRRVFTDGQSIFSSVAERESRDLVKWRAGEIDQVIAGAVFEQFLEEIEFDANSALAIRWWPLGRKTPVVLDPRIRFGAPVIEGTAVRTDVVADLAAGTDAETAAVAYELELRQVEAALSFEDQLHAA